MEQTAIESRAEQVGNPFIRALQNHPHFQSREVARYDSGDDARTPSVSVSAEMVEERLDHAGDSWAFEVTIEARRGAGDYAKLDLDAAAIEQVTTTAMAGDPNISLMIVEEGVQTSKGNAGKARLFTMVLPVFVVFS